MKCLTLCAALLAAVISHGLAQEPRLLELRQVVTKEDEGAIKAIHRIGDQEHELWLSPDVIVNQEDVAEAYLSPQQADAVSVVLNKQGGQKMSKATKEGHGVMRIAILVEGEVVSAPVVNAQLGERFIVEGFEDPQELLLLAGQLNGMEDDEIAEMLRKSRLAEPKPAGPELKPAGPEKSHLDMILPGEGLADDQFGTPEWLEQIQLNLREGHDKPHFHDYCSLLNLICSLADEEEDAQVDANCSVVKTLATGFAEVQQLREKAKNGKVSMVEMSKQLMPYMAGEMEFPKAMLEN